METQREDAAVMVQLQAPDSSTAVLLGGLVGDVQKLIRQEIALVRQQTVEDIGKLKRTAIVLASGGLLLALGGLLLVLALAQGSAALLHWPNWAGYAGIGGILAITGFLMIYIQRRSAKGRK